MIRGGHGDIKYRELNNREVPKDSLIRYWESNMSLLKPSAPDLNIHRMTHRPSIHFKACDCNPQQPNFDDLKQPFQVKACCYASWIVLHV